MQSHYDLVPLHYTNVTYSIPKTSKRKTQMNHSVRLVAHYLYISVHIECEITLRKRVYEANLGGVEADWKIWKQIRFDVEVD
jgi:hypothetical protein